MKTSLAVLALSFQLAAQGTTPAALPAPKEALLFKSGQGWLYRDVSVEPGSTETRLRMPDAVHGSVWLGAEDFEIRRARAHYADLPTERRVETLADILEASIGKRVSVTVVMGSEVRTQDAEVLRMIHPAPPQQNPNNIYYPVAGGRPLVALFTEGRGISTFPVDSIVGVSVLDAGREDLPTTFSKAERTPVLDVGHARAGQNENRSIGLAHLAGGLTWAPSYVLEISDDRSANARLVGKAVLINDSEDFVDTRVRLVIGFPNLKFAGVTSSLSPEVSLDMFRQMLNSSNSTGQSRGVMSQSAIMSNAFIPQTTASPSGPAVPTEGESSEDLFLYDIGQVTLGKGERSYVPLTDESISCEHRYDWNLGNRVDNNARFIRQNPDREPTPLWHVLQLQNDSEAPWTTAPILVQGERGPIAQSMITYTPSRTKTTVRLTKALDLVGRSVEFRSDDKTSPRDQRRLFGDLFENVVVEGRLELTNRKKIPVPVRIAKRLSGDLLEADGDPTVRGETKGLGQINASRLLVWEFDLAPGETWTADYRYRVLIRR